MSVYRRAGTRLLWIEYTAHGRRYQVSSGTADRRAAEKREREILRSIEAGTWTPPAARGQTRETVETYAERWIERRRKAGVRTADVEATRLRAYALPALVPAGQGVARLGSLALEDVRRPMIAAWLLDLQHRTSEATGRRLAPRTVRHIYDVLRTMMLDAVADEIIAATPCTLRERKGELPKKRDADPRWRAGAVYTRDEARHRPELPPVPHVRRAARNGRARRADPGAAPDGAPRGGGVVSAGFVIRECRRS